MGWNRQHDELLSSSLFIGTDEAPPKRHPGDVLLRVWLVMLNKARDVDGEGVYSSSLLGLAKEAWCRLEQTETAVCELESPDPHSRSTAEEGRRAIRLDGDEMAWKLVDWEKYRALAEKDGRSEYMRRFMKEKRAKDKTPEAQEKSRVAKALLDWWFTEWTRTVGNGKQKPVISNGAVQMQAAHRMLAAMSETTAQRVVTRHLTDRSSWWHKNGRLDLVHVAQAANDHLKALGEESDAASGPAVDDPRKRGGKRAPDGG